MTNQNRLRIQFGKVSVLRIKQLFCSCSVMLVAALLLCGCGDNIGYNTKLKIKSDQLHPGISVQEMTNAFGEFDVLSATNYFLPEKVDHYSHLERDHVEKWFTTNLTASWILYLGPKREGLWRDTCQIDFDTNNIIVGYEWMQIH